MQFKQTFFLEKLYNILETFSIIKSTSLLFKLLRYYQSVGHELKIISFKRLTLSGNDKGKPFYVQDRAFERHTLLMLFFETKTTKAT